MLRKIQQDEINRFYWELYRPYIEELSRIGGSGGMTENVLRYYLCNTPMEAYVIELDKKEVGFLLTEEVSPPALSRQMLYLVEFGIVRKHRCRGIGSHAFSELLSALDTPIFFIVLPKNEKAAAFWRRQIALNNLVPVKPDSEQIRFAEGNQLYCFEKRRD